MSSCFPSEDDAHSGNIQNQNLFDTALKFGRHLSFVTCESTLVMLLNLIKDVVW